MVSRKSRAEEAMQGPAPLPETRWLHGLMWRHARQVQRRRAETEARNDQLAALGLRPRLDRSGRVVALTQIEPNPDFLQRPVVSEPAEVSLPPHLRVRHLPGQVAEVDPGQECVVCFERRRDARLLPCRHQDLCYG